MPAELTRVCKGEPVPSLAAFKHWSAGLRSSLPATSAAWAANQTTRGKSLLDKSSVVNSRGSAKLYEWCLQLVGLGLEVVNHRHDKQPGIPREALGKVRPSKLPSPHPGRTGVQAMSEHCTVQSNRTTASQLKWQPCEAITLQQYTLGITKLKYFTSGISCKINKGFNGRIAMKCLSIPAMLLGLIDDTLFA